MNQNEGRPPAPIGDEPPLRRAHPGDRRGLRRTRRRLRPRDERHLDDAIQRLSLLQWLGDGEWTGHNQVEGPPTLSGPVESYASPEHRRQQAQARRAAAARVAAQREDSSDLAPEHPGRVSTTPRNRSSAGSSRSGDHLARFETGDY